MGWRTEDEVTADFTVQNPVTGAATDADSTPTGTLVINGVDDAATVTVTNKSAGNYKASVVLPTITSRDLLQIRIAATVGGVTGKGVIWNGQGASTVAASGSGNAFNIRAGIDFGELDLYAGLTEDFPFAVALFESDGQTPAQLGPTDVVHCVLSERTKGEPTTVVLDIPSDAETTNESRVYLTDRGNADTGDAAIGYVRFAQADTLAIVAAWEATIVSKRFVCEFYYVDSSESNPADARKLFLRGTIHLHRSGASV